MVWKRAKTEDGNPYYYNTETNATSWDKPEEIELSDEEERRDEQLRPQLIQGYESSSSDEDEAEEAEEQKEAAEQEEAVEESSLGGGAQQSAGKRGRDEAEGKRTELWALFERAELDPYSAWVFESEKVSGDAAFYSVSDDEARQELFEEWCARKVAEEGGAVLDEGEEAEEADLVPTRFHYLAHIVSKSSISQDTVYSDVRREHKDLFSQLEIDVLDKKEQQRFVASLLFYYKKMDADQRREVFRKFLLAHRAAITKAFLEDGTRLREVLEDDELPQDAYSIETDLFIAERCIGLHGTLSKLQTDVKYYVLGVKDKAVAMREVLREMLSEHLAK
ncbi:AaceriAFR317Cp [[Ashbya] aceris (nom. inval.)]|nr:AaceriAFR317Cp [[Ashbya] aceris (nom. inval.)]